jgi:hypothetical protein
MIRHVGPAVRLGKQMDPPKIVVSISKRSKGLAGSKIADYIAPVKYSCCYLATAWGYAKCL